ncbi:EcoRI family type II restriction endonuclease [Spiroplasma chrysopicola]|uniref:Type II restriction enzyme, EcoRI family n=1 Tax=Spiroplasma chrysopicola DF-1 TaxID=1276227 RepID=R4UBH7_9MOLU|nr:EcoRI family type II restriction endonuclease [Spiroplasma chrysopicola]AGM25249.1 type II restriction enzyme, EcoRI family [Spiroplasma chrysopicola DF-1]
MASSKQLQLNANQHISKYSKSKSDDKDIYLSINEVIIYLKKRFTSEVGEKGDDKKYYISFTKALSIDFMLKMIKSKTKRREYYHDYNDRTIKPEGGFILLRSNHDPDFCRIILISELKRQGTNDQRLQEGKKKQAKGNAIERLGKNLIGIRAMMMHEKITPFICFGWGCDFNHEDTYIDSKLFMMNEFYKINTIYVFKKDGGSDYNYFAPVSMFFREERWTIEEMYEYMKEIAETAFRYYTQ